MSRFRRLSLAIAALALVTTACGDEPSATGPRPPAPTAILDDGSSGGNPNFFFLPPIAANPSGHPEFEAGEFNGGWHPVVEICQVNAADLAAGCVGPVLRTLSGAEVTVSIADEHYAAQVDTRETWAVAGSSYRASVYLPGHLRLGFVDFTLAADRSSATNRRTGEVISFNDGRTIPLKFRIENGAAVSGDAEVFVEAVVTQEGDTLRAGGTGGPGTFAIGFPANWLPEGFDEVLVTVEKLQADDPEHCTASVPDAIHTSECWRVETYPTIPRLEQDVIVAFCPAITEADPRYDAQLMYKFDLPETLLELENVATTLVDCDGEVIGAMPDDVLGRVRWGATQVARGLGRVFGPATAHAIDVGLGGRLVASDESSEEGVFSEFFWAVPLRIDPVSGFAPATAITTPQQLVVRVTGAHAHETPVAMSGILVTAAFANALVSPATATTNALGEATFTVTPTGSGVSGTFSITSIGANTSVAYAATASGVVAQCGGEGYDVGDLLDRGFYYPAYPAGRLAGAQVRFGTQVEAAGSYTAVLVARDSAYDGPVLGADTVTFDRTATTAATSVGFAWTPVSTVPGRTIAFSLAQLAGPATLYYSVAQSFAPGDASCPLIETEGTAPMLDTVRRQGVEATVFSFFTPIL